MRFERESWRKLYVAESMQHRLLPVLCRGLRDYLLRYASEDGTLLARTDSPAQDLAKALGSHPDEADMVARFAEGWLADGYLSHKRGRLFITRYSEAQEARSPGASRQAKYRDSKRVTSDVTGDATSNETVTSPGDARDTSQKTRRDETRNDETEPPVVPRGDDSLRADVRRVFEAWQEIHGHQGCKLERTRGTRIQARLREKFTAEQLIEALRNAKNDRFLMGENEHGRVYDGIETLLKNGPTVERLLKLKAVPTPARPVAANPRTAAADAAVDRQAARDLEIERAKLERANRMFAGGET